MPVEIRRNFAKNPIGPMGIATAWWLPTRGAVTINGDALRLTINDNNPATLAQRIESPLAAGFIPAVPGQIFTASAYLRSNAAVTGVVDIGFMDSGNVLIGAYNYSTNLPLNPTTSVRHICTSPPAPANTVKTVIQMGMWLGTKTVGDWIDFKQVLIESKNTLSDWFDGNSLEGGGVYYQWTGAVANSESVAMEPDYAPGINTKYDTIYTSLVSGGYGPGSLADMEYKRLLATNGLSAPQKLTLYDLYAKAGERPRLR
jgi:hypothetical protein